MTALETLAALRAEVTPDGMILLDRLTKELDLHEWPGAVLEQAVEIFGPKVYGNSPTRRSLDRKISHALRIWTQRCGGSLSFEQEQYASEVLCWALRAAYKKWCEKGRPTNPGLIAMSCVALSDLLDNDTVHAGFKARTGLVSLDTILT